MNPYDDWFTAHPPAWAVKRDNGDDARNLRADVRARALAAGWPRWAAETVSAVAWNYNDLKEVSR
jgi:hypothetical protein